MRRVVSLALVLALVAASGALAARGDPKKELKPADQARARAMLLRRSDFGLAFKAIPSTGGESSFYCKALDESDLTLTGEAESPTFQGGVEFVSSLAQVYESNADSAASWKRGTSAAGDACVRAQFRREFARQGATLESFTRMSFPRLTERAAAYRLVLTTQGVRAYVDVVVLKQGRAQSALLLGSALTPMPREVELELARTVARRMKAAMRA